MRWTCRGLTDCFHEVEWRVARLRRCRDLLSYSVESIPNLEAVNTSSHPDDTVRAVFFRCTKRN